MIFRNKALGIIPILILMSIEVYAQWDDIYNNRKIVFEDGAQYNQVVVPDNEGGCFFLWQDERDSVNIAQIYVQHYDSVGDAKWPEGGIRIAPTSWHQAHLRAIADGAGGVIAVWADHRDRANQPQQTSTDIWGQHINSQGALLWGAVGKSIVLEAGEQSMPLLVSDDQGGAICAFRDGGDFQAGRSKGFWMQRFDQNGTAKWDKGGMLIHQSSQPFAPGIEWDLCADGFGGAVLVYEESSLNTSLAGNIYGHRVDASGTRFWEPDRDTLAGIVFERGFPISKMPGNEELPKIEADQEGNIYVCWRDKRNSSWKIGALYAQRLDLNGAKLWTEDGVQIESGNLAGGFLDLECDMYGGIYFSYPVNSVDEYEIVRFDTSGNRSWSPRLINSDITYLSNLARSGDGGVWVAWNETTRNPGSEAAIVTQKFDTSGNKLINGDALLCSYPEDKGVPKIAVNGDDILYCAWEDWRRTMGQSGSDADVDLFAQRYKYGGSTGLQQLYLNHSVSAQYKSGILQVNVSGISGIEMDYQIFDLQGRLIMQGVIPLSNEMSELAVNDMKTGIYFLVLDHMYSTRFICTGF
ncbi:MAG: T9SS type A sorting domain-containing protein [Flavobacteriales bacterium]|nr:T9SS type A sorting domain-containing protein [Flavobacteriales bacterium]